MFLNRNGFVKHLRSLHEDRDDLLAQCMPPRKKKRLLGEKDSRKELMNFKPQRCSHPEFLGQILHQSTAKPSQTPVLEGLHATPHTCRMNGAAASVHTRSLHRRVICPDLLPIISGRPLGTLPSNDDVRASRLHLHVRYKKSSSSNRNTQ